MSESKNQKSKKDSILNYSFSFIREKDIVIFSRQFAILISANVSLIDSLKILADQTENVSLQKIIVEIKNEVDEGLRLSDSLEKRPKVFSGFYTNIVKSGESSGKLDEVLNYLADELEKDYDMMRKIKGAMIYPAFIIVVMAILGSLMMIFIVPQLTDTLAESGAELPLATKILVAISSFLANYWILIIIFIFIVIVAYRMFVKTVSGKMFLDKLLLKSPILGKLYNKIFLVRFTRSFNTLLNGGVTMSESLRICAGMIDNVVYTNLILETEKRIEDGSSMSVVFAESSNIPKMVPQMIQIGEKTGRLDIVFEKISNFYAREVENTIANLMTLLEPLIIVVIGAAVGGMVIAVIMPMYNMANVM